MRAIIGKKIGMTQVIDDRGVLVPVTAVEAGPCVVTELRKPEKHGYHAVQLGFGEVKEKKVSKAYQTNFKKKKLPLKKWLKEFRLDPKVSPEDEYKIGQEIKADIFEPGDKVDVQGTSIGKGFAGGMKRWGWGGGPGSHGSMFHRRIGSAGQSATPSRTFRGLHMPGRLGGVTKNIQNLEIIKVDPEKNLLLVKGSIPGGDNNLLFIRQALKKPVRPQASAEPKKEEKKKDAGKKA